MKKTSLEPGFPEYLRRVWRAIIEFDLIAPRDRILIGLSGGKDSLFLTEALAAVRQRSTRPFELAALTIDGQFAAGFPLDKLRTFCEKLAIPFFSQTMAVEQLIASGGGKDPCATCSFFRRGALNRFAVENGFTKLALAHHHDDAVETFLMSIFYAGRVQTFLPKVSQERAGISVIRPLIYLREHEIRSAIKTMKLRPIKNPCPYNGKTKRQEIKQLIRHYEKKDPGFYQRFTAAMRCQDTVSIWPAKPTRATLRKNYLDFKVEEALS